MSLVTLGRADFRGSALACIIMQFPDIISSRIWFLRSQQKARRLILPEGYHVRRTWYNKKQCYANKKGAAMNRYIGQPFAALRYEKNILVVEETTSAGGCGSFNAASSCPASACLHDSAA